MDEPQYVVFLMIDEPKGIKETFGFATAGWVAAPAVANVIQGMGNVLNMQLTPVDAKKDISHGLKKYVSLDNG